jgi:hypothetical protein
MGRMRTVKPMTRMTTSTTTTENEDWDGNDRRGG